MIEPLGNDKGPIYAAARRIEAVLTEAVISGALTAEELALFRVHHRGCEAEATHAALAAVRERIANRKDLICDCRVSAAECPRVQAILDELDR